ncbi:unnamed protein product [Leptosia nina]|uniref:Uncharacterized protein n=1 Tax=Leptosia nina TaxID=320188 RepID=A0AAV1IZ06_9NEOP
MESDKFQLELQKNFGALKNVADIDSTYTYLVKIVREAGLKHFRSRSKGQKSKLTEETLELMKKRREDPNLPEPDRKNLNR